MNDDVAEVNGSAPPMLPGSFLHKKEPGYEATLNHYGNRKCMGVAMTSVATGYI